MSKLSWALVNLLYVMSIWVYGIFKKLQQERELALRKQFWACSSNNKAAKIIIIVFYNFSINYVEQSVLS